MALRDVTAAGGGQIRSEDRRSAVFFLPFCFLPLSADLSFFLVLAGLPLRLAPLLVASDDFVSETSSLTDCSTSMGSSLISSKSDGGGVSDGDAPIRFIGAQVGFSVDVGGQFGGGGCGVLNSLLCLFRLCPSL